MEYEKAPTNNFYKIITLLSESNDFLSLQLWCVVFTEMGYDMDWFITEAAMHIDVDNEESEVILWKLKFDRYAYDIVWITQNLRRNSYEKIKC